ncbi:MAG: hypothetical protein VX864_03840, partial [Pseudomonadota bacterium]|nr:hypothetical protein [Pseudomonadota bacterium]
LNFSAIFIIAFGICDKVLFSSSLGSFILSKSMSTAESFSFMPVASLRIVFLLTCSLFLSIWESDSNILSLFANDSTDF